MLLRYIARRIPYVIPQLFGIILVSFFMVKLIPGDPAVMMLGPMASERSLTALREKMGVLTFSELVVRPLGQGYALTTGKFALKRTETGGGDASGRFTLIFKKTPAGWKIIHDHTS